MDSSIFSKTPQGDGIPAAPQEVEQWLSSLSTDDPVQHGQRFYAGLKEINHQVRTAQVHLDMMGELHSHARSIARKLRAAVREYPLSIEARQIVHLNQAILAEMAAGYSRVLHRATNGDCPLTADDRARAIHYAIALHGEQLLTAALVYAPALKGVWRSIHRLYRLAERDGLLEAAVTDADPAVPGASSVLDIYLRTVLLALARPQSLRQGEALLLAAFFERASRGCKISLAPLPDRSTGIYCVDTLSDSPPDYRAMEDAPASAETRYFDLAPLIAVLKKCIRGGNPAGTETSLGIDLSRAVLDNLTTPAKRQFSRSQRDARVYVAIGLDGIHRAVSDDADATEMPHSKPESWQSWHLVDASAGGYCLLCRGTADPGVQVGDLMAVRERFNTEHLWRIGVIRWMRCREDRALETGIQLLAPKATPVVLRTLEPSRILDESVKALMLPPVRSIGQPPTLLTLPDRLWPGEQVIMELHAHERQVQLTGVDGQSECFSQFRYSSRQREQSG